MRVIFSRRAEKDFLKLNPLLQSRISKKLLYFSGMPDPLQYAEPLTKFSGGGSYRFRVGDYRIVFDVERNAIAILYIEHRKDVYRGK